MVGYGVKEEKLLPMTVDGGSIECVAEFPYLGSLTAANGRIDVEVDKRIACASKAFGAYICLCSRTPNYLSPPRGKFTKCMFCQCYCMEGNAEYHSDVTSSR